MFTGLVQGLARIEHVERLAADGGVRLTRRRARVPGFAAEVGDSIALNGACMTATQVDGQRASRSMCRAKAWARPPDSTRRARSMSRPRCALATSSAAIWSSGHVDGIGEVLRFAQVQESWELVIRAPGELARYLAIQGIRSPSTASA